MFTLTIQTDGAAFEDDEPAPELARILRRLASEIGGGLRLSVAGAGGVLRDINGNTVGRWTFETEDLDTLDYCAWCEEADSAPYRAGEGHDPECPFGGSRLFDYPEGTTAICGHCYQPIALDDNGAGGHVWVHDFGSTVCYDDPPGRLEGENLVMAVPDLDTIERP